jgi:hypothetical protein
MVRAACALALFASCVDPTPPGSNDVCETDTLPADSVRAQYLRALCARWEECGWSEPQPCLEAMDDGRTGPGECDCAAANDCLERLETLSCTEFSGGTAPAPCDDGPIGECFATCI